jgi:hypothetical protein
MRHSRGGRKLLAACLVAASASACRAKVNAKASVNAGEAQANDDRKWEVPEPASAPSEAPPASAQPAPRVAALVAPAAPPSGGVSFVGVTHDLSLASGVARTEVCRCLMVAYGAPSDGKFAWQAGAPTTEQDAIAIAIDGLNCPGRATAARASISGIERDGADIVVVVENVGEGRPVMRGALTTSPGPNGAIVVRTRHGTPYPAASGTGSCRIALK